ncbi:MAG: hypothetical protein RDV41_04310 [Planctomycetota bacterium]|nr:hypothetical protein [Planctomycetota bacterium]
MLICACAICSLLLSAMGCSVWPFGKKGEQPEPEAPQPTGTTGSEPTSRAGMVSIPRSEFERLMTQVELVTKEYELLRLQQAQGLGGDVAAAVTPEEKDMVIADIQRVDAQLADLRRQKMEIEKRMAPLVAERARLVARLGGESGTSDLFGLEDRSGRDRLDPLEERRLEEIRRRLPNE